MIQNPYHGKFIAFEGMDGCGKSTQCTKAHNFLLAGGESAIKVKEPDVDVLGGKLIYGLLFDKGPVGFSSMVQLERQGHYFLNRIQHYVQKVIPALKSGVNVLSDRSLASIALDVIELGDLEKLLKVEEYYFQMEEVDFIRPDLVIIYDVEPAIAVQRLSEKDERRRDFFEKPDKLQRTRDAYREFASKFRDFCWVVDATDNADMVFARSTRELLKRNFKLQEWR